jgi:hypothetical protein
MGRCSAALLLALIQFSSVHASLENRERSSEHKFLPLKSILSLSASSPQNDEFRITQQTEVLLDGRPCRYEQIPEGATIILLETVTNESKEISRIHFRSPRRTAAPASK